MDIGDKDETRADVFVLEMWIMEKIKLFFESSFQNRFQNKLSF